MTTPTQTDLNAKVLQLLREDASKIEQLIAVQLDNSTLPKCPAFEEMMNMRMYVLSRQVDFAVRAGLIKREQGQPIIDELQRKLEDSFTIIMP